MTPCYVCVGVKDRSARATGGTSEVGRASGGAHKLSVTGVQCSVQAPLPALASPRPAGGKARAPSLPAPVVQPAHTWSLRPPQHRMPCSAPLLALPAQLPAPQKGFPECPLQAALPLMGSCVLPGTCPQPALFQLAYASPRFPWALSCPSQPRQLTVEDGRPVPNAL